jgi:predicted aspartyl protease
VLRTGAFLFLLAGLVQAADDAVLRAALDEHRWFDLRDAVTGGQAPAFYPFWVAVAFNDLPGAERGLKAAVRSRVATAQLADMHNALGRAYFRVGRYRDGAREERLSWTLAPDKAPAGPAAKADLEARERLPDQEVIARRSATLTYTDWMDSPRISCPMTINGQTAQYALDTDAGMSGTTEAEAKRLGLRIIAGPASYDGFTGAASSSGHYAVADRLKIGTNELRNVAFLVYPDGLDVFEKAPPEQRGAIGLPVLIALQTLAWNRNHELRIGFRPGRADLRHANLAYEELDPLVAVEVDGRRATVDLDTGSTFTQMWPAFAQRFPDQVQKGRKSTASLHGATGSGDVESVIVPELQMTVAGFPITLRDLHVLLEQTIWASHWHDGMLGFDELAKATRVRIDFKAMRLDVK